MAINYLNSIDLNQNELLHAQIENQASDVLAGTGVEGQLYFNTTDDVLKVWANGAWSSISGDITSVTAGNYLNGGGSIGDITINHDTTTRADTTSSDSPGYGGTFEAVTSVTTNTYGHVTAIDVSTVTVPASDNTDTTYQLSVGAGAADTAVVTLDASSGTDTTLTIGVQDQALTISETTGVNGAVTLGLNTSIEKSITFTEDIFIQGELDMSSTIAMNSNYIQSLADPVNAQDAATKAYVDAATVGGLVYQGGYNAATNTPNLDSNPSPNPIKKGWTYTVTADGSFFTEQVRVGDVLVAENDAPTTLAEWTTVQNNIDLASLTQVGIGNVNAGDAIDVSYSSGTATVSVEDSTATNKGAIIVSAETNADLRGIYANYDAPGEVVVGLNIDGIPEDATPPMDESVVVYNDQQTGENYSIQISDLLALASGQTSYAATITDTATITHSLGTKDVIIQLYDVTTDETVYADVERASTNTATITFASTPTNSIRVLVQKIG